jgi:hypothetical protein
VAKTYGQSVVRNYWDNLFRDYFAFGLMWVYLIILPVGRSMSSSGQRSTDEKLVLKPVVALKRQDLER